MKLSFSELKLSGSVTLPSSKSISNRLLVMKALGNRNTQIIGLSESSDTQFLIKAFDIIQNSDKILTTLDVEDAGTPFRFLTAILCLQENKSFRLTGNQRMQQRPIKDLVVALRQLGADIYYENKEDFPPLLIKGKKLEGRNIKIDGHISSQFVSALCLIAPLLKNGLQINVQNQLVSADYVKMTLKLMQLQGIKLNLNYGLKNDLIQIDIAQQDYQCTNTRVNKDWSAATFIYAMAMIKDEVDIFFPDLFADGLQGDEYIITLGKQFGIITTQTHEGIRIHKHNVVDKNIRLHLELANYPDLAMPLLIACAIAYPYCTFVGLQHLELKESKRLTALQNELQKVGIQLIHHQERVSFLKHKKTQQSKSVAFESYHDHRVVMALSLFALCGYNIVFNEVDCVRKSFPTFFNELIQLQFKLDA
jgi:3-phosphoshikimate 1-carboxyvinyltransferase